MLGPFTFTFTLESEEFEKFEKVAALDLYQTMITTRAPDGANKVKVESESSHGIVVNYTVWYK